jgi:hypothetical protein
MRVDKHGVHIETRANWEGFVTSNGEVVELTNRKGTNLTLKTGDYGTIYYGDLQILIRLGKPRSASYRKEKPKCRPSLLSLAFYSSIEKKVMAIAMVAAVLVLVPAIYFVMNKKSARPTSLADLRDEYIESFVYPDHFSTIPEALQNHLDRSNYPRAVINYYNSIAELLIGWPLSSPTLIFDSSELYFSKLHDQRKNNLEELESNQNDYEESYLSKPQSAMVDIPIVRTESLRTTVLKLFDKIDLHQDSLREQLDTRRKIRAYWEEVPAFNATNYRATKSAEQKAVDEKLRQISPFKMESDEANMYRIATHWADRSSFRRKTITLRSSPKEPLLSPNTTEVTIPPSMNFASFLQKAAVLANEDKLASIQASLYGVTPAAKIKEPLIGEIDPKLVQKTVEDNWHGLRLCYELALRRDKSLAGDMEWRWRIDSRGDISEIELINSSIGDNRMLNCIKSKMGAWRFPPPRRGSVQIRYPFRFSKTKG